MEDRQTQKEKLFPLRAACIDMGSNAIRFVAAEFLSAKQYNILESQRAPVRLGHEVFLCGKLEQKAMDSALAAINEFIAKMESLKIKHYKAVATSAVRESSNGDIFIDRIKRETGLNIEIITGSEELRLIYLSVRSKIELGNKKWFLTDIGGGSVELALIDDSGILWSESHTMGSVRLLEELKGTDDEPGRFRKLLEEYISILRMPTFKTFKEHGGLIATGGNIEELAKLAAVLPDKDNLNYLNTSDLHALIKTLSRLSYKDRMKELGLKDDRADVILPAALVYEKIASLVGEEKILVPYVGAKEGLLIDLVDQLTSTNDREKHLEEQSFNAAINLGRKYIFDEGHCIHVAKIALSIFDQTKSIHQLGDSERKILLAGAALHDIGTFISYKKHHKHSLYIISQSELPYYNPREMMMAAVVARYHRKNEPDPQHEIFCRLNDSEKMRTTKLASILRMADALDREHLQKVKYVKIKIEKPFIFLDIDGIGELHLESWALKRKAQMFLKLFNLKLRINNEKGDL